MRAILWTNGWVGPSRGSGHENRISLPLPAIKPKTPRSTSTYNIEVNFHITHAPAPTQPSTDSAQHKLSLPPNFTFKNVWTKFTSQFKSHMFLCGSSEQDVVYCSGPMQPLHIWHTSLLCSPTKLTTMAIEEPAKDSWPSLPQWTAHVTQHQFGNQPHCTENTIRTLQQTPSFSIPETNCLVLFRDIIAVYCDSCAKHVNSLLVRAKKFSLGGWKGGGMALRMYRIYLLFQKLCYDNNNVISATVT
jgi:hypothetical protein